MSQTIGVNLEETNALKDAQDYLNERGSDVIIRINNEVDVDRDVYGSIKKKDPTTVTLHAWPIIHNPSDYELKKAGIKEKVDVIITFAVKDFTDNSLEYENIDNIRWEFCLDSINSEIYLMKDKNRINRFSYTFLNYVVGLNKK